MIPLACGQAELLAASELMIRKAIGPATCQQLNLLLAQRQETERRPRPEQTRARSVEGIGLGDNPFRTLQRIPDLDAGNRAFSPDAPKIAAQLYDSRCHDSISLAGVQNQGNAVPELMEDFVAACTSGRAGEIRACSCQGHANFLNQALH
jgi:hypothetical protein